MKAEGEKGEKNKKKKKVKGRKGGHEMGRDWTLSNAFQFPDLGRSYG